MDTHQNPYASPQSDAKSSGDSSSEIGANPKQMRWVYIGLSLVYWGIILIILGMMAVIGVSMLSGGSPFEASFFLSVAAFACIGIGGLLSFIGPFFCLTVPRESGAKPYLIASVISQAINITFTPLSPCLGIDYSIAYIVTNAVGLLSACTFVLFLQRLANYLQQPKIVTQSRNVLIAGGVLLVVFLATIIPPVATMIFEALGVLFGLAVLIFALVVFVMYVNVINAVRKAVEQAGI